MAMIELFVYETPEYMWRMVVGLDDTNGQAYDLLYAPSYGYYGEILKEKIPITYEEVRKKAKIAHDTGLAQNDVKIVNPSDYDSLNQDTWPQFVQNPPSRIWNRTTKND